MNRKLLFLFLSASITFSACVKKKTEITGDTYSRFVNAIPGSVAQDVYLNNNKAVTGLNFPDQSNYITYTSGLSDLSITNTGTTDTNLAYSYGADIGGYTTVFFFRDFTGALVSGGVKDDKTAPAAGKARVRFVNVDNQSQTSFTADVVGGQNLLESLVFATASPYFEVDPGSKFLIKTLVATNPVTLDFDPQAGQIYTIWVCATTNTDLEAYYFSQN